jgi:hypothetical protein
MNQQQIQAQLFDWEIPQALWSCARSRGMTTVEFAEFWREFVATNVNKRNSGGKLVLAEQRRAEMRAYLALRDAGWPASRPRSGSGLGPEWVPIVVRDSRGRCLEWRVLTP